MKAGRLCGRGSRHRRRPAREHPARATRERFGTGANVVARIPVNDHIRREEHLAEIEAQWGPAPGRHQTDGASIFVLGARFGQVLVGVQPAMGYEGDPMRLLFERGFAPTHAFSAFYRYLREDFGGRRGAAFRHARLARIHAGQAGRHVRVLLAGAPDRRPAERLPLRRKQSVRRRARQTPLGGDARELPYPLARAGRTLSRPARTSRRRSSDTGQRIWRRSKSASGWRR